MQGQNIHIRIYEGVQEGERNSERQIYLPYSKALSNGLLSGLLERFKMSNQKM